MPKINETGSGLNKFIPGRPGGGGFHLLPLGDTADINDDRALVFPPQPTPITYMANVHVHLRPRDPNVNLVTWTRFVVWQGDHWFAYPKTCHGTWEIESTHISWCHGPGFRVMLDVETSQDCDVAFTGASAAVWPL